MSTPELGRLQKALDARLALLGPGPSDAQRLFHGRGGCFPGLESVCVDWYQPVVLVTLYSDAAQGWLGDLVDHLRARLGERLACVLAQQRHRPRAPTELVYGELPEAVWAREAGLRFRLRLGSAKNIGFFPDMRRGRALVRSLAAGRRVLNLFAYTCSFSVAALAGDATQVVNLDMNRGALALGRENHRANGLDLRSASFLNHELFRSFGRLRTLGPYGLIVIDPPSAQGRSFSARRDWPRLVRQLDGLADPVADVIACLNAPRLGAGFLRELFAGVAGSWELASRLGPPDDFPERETERGLKILQFRRPG
jgi:23S rRNA (cytosine1962-C5)-methyltransferase